MTYPIQRQSDSYGVFDDGDLHFARDRRGDRDLPEGLVNMLAGPRITAGLNNPRSAVNVQTMDPASHAYQGHPEGGYGYQNEFGGQEMSNPEYGQYEQNAQGIAADDASGYNWGPEPQGDQQFREEPQPALQPLDDMLEHTHRPDAAPPPPHDYLAQFRPHLASFTEARSLEAEDSGPAPGLFNPAIYQPGPGDPRSTLFGGEKAFINDAPVTQGVDWVTAAAAVSPQVVPGWIGHGYAPGHRVNLPLPQGTFKGTVTHLDGQEVGIRWDDGQHSTEEPKDLRPS